MGADPPRGPRIRHTDLLVAPVGRKRTISARAIARRGRNVVWAKRLLPAAALVLLALVVLWPEFNRMTAAGRQALKRMNAAASIGGQVVDAHYRGVDERGHAYTLTADTGRQLSSELIGLAQPRADTSLAGGGWVFGSADRGVYTQHRGELDLTGHVTLYRDDGIFLWTETATVDLKSGFATGANVVSVEGPFGTLDATGFSVADKGTAVQFAGPARMILNAKSK